MYGQPDIYSSPQSAQYGLHEFDDFGAHEFDDFGAHEDDDEFGILGIALTRKARQKKWNRKLDRTMGKLKKLHGMGKLDKAQKRAKKLTKIVTKLEKVEDDFEASPEVVAWMDFAESGDSAALEEALAALAWTGEEVAVAAPTMIGPTMIEPSGLVRTPASGVRGGVPGVYRPSPRGLPRGFRPRGYARWRRRRRIDWMKQHPRASSVAHPADPRRRGRGRRDDAQAARGPGRERALPRAGRGAVFRTGRAAGRTGDRGAESRRGTSTRFPHAGRKGMFKLGRSAGRRGYGAIDEAVSEAAEEMGFIPGTIGIEAFNVRGSGLTRATLLESDAVDDIMEFDDVMEEEEEYGYSHDDEYGYSPDDEYGLHEGTTHQRIVEEGPQFGAVFKRKTEKRLEGARKRYERQRDRAVSAEDWLEVEHSLDRYRKLAHAYKKAAVAPTPRKKEQALAALEEQPLFHSAGVARFEAAGGSLGGFPMFPTDSALALAGEEELWRFEEDL